MNAYRNAGLYRQAADPQAKPEHIMGVTLNEFPERTVRSADGGIEALGWREALTALIIERQIEPNETVRTWLGGDGVAFALGKRKSEGIIAEISSR